MNLFEQQAANRRRSWGVVATFVAFLVLLGAGFDYFFIGAGGGVWPVGTVAAMGIGGASSMVSFFSGDRAVLTATGATDVATLVAAASDDNERLKLRQLQNVVDEMAIAAGLPRPAVYVVPDVDPNAFATGRGPEHSSIAVTRGLLDALNRDELQGVVAHEMSHIRNLDVRLLTIIAALVGTIALLSQWTARLMRHGSVSVPRGRSKDGKGGGVLLPVLFAVWVLAMLLAPLLSRLLAMMVSRQREYLADATAAELTRNPLGLAHALEKIDGAVGPTERIALGSAHLCIADPLGRAVNVKEGFWADRFASHPPMARRIELLRAMALAGPRSESS